MISAQIRKENGGKQLSRQCLKLVHRCYLGERQPTFAQGFCQSEKGYSFVSSN